jgi:hypothetical protein
MYQKKSKQYKPAGEAFSLADAEYGNAALNSKHFNDIATPAWLCDKIHEIYHKYYQPQTLIPWRESHNKYARKAHANQVIRNFDISILDPCRGGGNMAAPFKKYGYENITEFDITAGINFYDYPEDNKFDLIIMNPPFSSEQNTLSKDRRSQAERFVRKGIIHLKDENSVLLAIVPMYSINNSIRNLPFWNKHIDRFWIISKDTFMPAALVHTVLIACKQFTENSLFLYDITTNPEQEKLL